MNPRARLERVASSDAGAVLAMAVIAHLSQKHLLHVPPAAMSSMLSSAASRVYSPLLASHPVPGKRAYKSIDGRVPRRVPARHPSAGSLLESISLEETELLLALHTQVVSPTTEHRYLSTNMHDNDGGPTRLLMDDGTNGNGAEDESYTIRCVCGEDDDAGFQIQCEQCSVWQHGVCVGYASEDDCPENYYCEVCRPQGHPALWGTAKEVMTPVKKRSGSSRRRGRRTAGDGLLTSSPTMSRMKAQVDRFGVEDGDVSDLEAQEHVAGDEFGVGDDIVINDNEVHDHRSSGSSSRISATPVAEVSVDATTDGNLAINATDEDQDEASVKTENGMENEREPELNGAGKPIRERKQRQLINMVRFINPRNARKRKTEGEEDVDEALPAMSSMAAASSTLSKSSRAVAQASTLGQLVQPPVKKRNRGADSAGSARASASITVAEKLPNARIKLAATSRAALNRAAPTSRSASNANASSGKSAVDRDASISDSDDDDDRNTSGAAAPLAPPCFKPRPLPTRTSVTEMQRRVRDILRYIGHLQLDLVSRDSVTWASEHDDEDYVSDSVSATKGAAMSSAGPATNGVKLTRKEVAKARREDLVECMQALTRDAMLWQQKWDAGV